jgi:hypothetical protein
MPFYNAKCHYPKCCILFIIMLNVIMLMSVMEPSLYTRLKHLKALLLAPALRANIRLSYEGLVRTNTVAYFLKTSEMEKPYNLESWFNPTPSTPGQSGESSSPSSTSSMTRCRCHKMFLVHL